MVYADVRRDDESNGEVASEAGLFTWDILANLLYGDPAVAALFGLDAVETMSGLPLEDYLGRVHPEDRPPLAKVISDTIIVHVPQQGTYRVLSADGAYMRVAAFGRAFRNRSGISVLYSGIVVPATAADRTGLH